MKIGKTGTKSLLLRGIFALTVMLVFAFAAPSHVSAASGKNDDHLISLPDKKNDGKTKPAATQKATVKYEESLRGVIYDLTRTNSGAPTGLEKKAKTENPTDSDINMLPVLKHFVLSGWAHRTGPDGRPNYTDFSKYYVSPVVAERSYFYQDWVQADESANILHPDNIVYGPGTVAIYSGYVKAPFTGKFRFVGFGGDVIVVRFQDQLVLDYGLFSLTLGTCLNDMSDFKRVLGGAFQNDRERRSIMFSPVYSKCKMETRFSTLFDSYGLATGVTLNVSKGDVIPIEILTADISGTRFASMLFIERLTTNGAPYRKNPTTLPLFHTSENLPLHGNAPEFDEDSPVWPVVDRYGKPIPERNPAKLPKTTEKKDTGKKTSSSSTTKKNSGSTSGK